MILANQIIHNRFIFISFQFTFYLVTVGAHKSLFQVYILKHNYYNWSFSMCVGDGTNVLRKIKRIIHNLVLRWFFIIIDVRQYWIDRQDFQGCRLLQRVGMRWVAHEDLPWGWPPGCWPTGGRWRPLIDVSRPFIVRPSATCRLGRAWRRVGPLHLDPENSRTSVFSRLSLIHLPWLHASSPLVNGPRN